MIEMLNKCYIFKHTFSNMLVKANIFFKLKFSSFSVCTPNQWLILAPHDRLRACGGLLKKTIMCPDILSLNLFCKLI